MLPSNSQVVVESVSVAAAGSRAEAVSKPNTTNSIEGQISVRVEPAMTQLMKDVKFLLEALTEWSQGKANDARISNIYVQLGNTFTDVKSAFKRWGIDMSELIMMPEDLRSHLELCLSEEPSPSVLQSYLPNIHKAIANMLQGLKAKHILYRRLTAKNPREVIDSGTKYGVGQTEKEQISSLLIEKVKRMERDRSPSARRDMRDRGPALRNHTQDKMKSSGSRFRMIQSSESSTHDKGTKHQLSPVVESGLSPSSTSRTTVTDNATAAGKMALISGSHPLPHTSKDDPIQESLRRELERSGPLKRRASQRYSVHNWLTSVQSKNDERFPQETRTSDYGSNIHQRQSAAYSGYLSVNDLESLATNGENIVSSVYPTPEIRVSPSEERSMRQEAHQPSSLPNTRAPLLELTKENSTSLRASVKETKRIIRGSPSSITVFLKAGFQTKKATLALTGLSLESLRELFTERFGCSYGTEDFPAIYITDPDSRIEYELEDLRDIREKSLLSLNVECESKSSFQIEIIFDRFITIVLGQVKQHLDGQMANLVKEFKEYSSMVTQLQEFPKYPISAESTVSSQRLKSTIPPKDRLRSLPVPRPPQLTKRSTAMACAQFDEVQSLRDELSATRQLYIGFVNQTKETFAVLKKETSSFQQIVSTKALGGRIYIGHMKSGLDQRSQDILADIEELQDVIDGLKLDVLKRKISPKPTLMRGIKENIQSASGELQDLTARIKTAKPLWKRTWQEELQNIVDEQDFLRYQEELICDLREDHAALTGVFSQLEQVVTLQGTRGSAYPGLTSFTSSDNGLRRIMGSIILEIRKIVVDPQRRMFAILELEQKYKWNSFYGKVVETSNKQISSIPGVQRKLVSSPPGEFKHYKPLKMSDSRIFNTGMTPWLLPHPIQYRDS
ncbi:hypothetical protein M422DRAFT_240944 [Sphaerobolus stellatus SS14]|nr:hypothetical protein M422DRAFT_240944 [Sphaerobolus stellatus SS14]